MKNLWKKWIFIAQIHFQDPDPDSEYGFGSSLAILIRIHPDPEHCILVLKNWRLSDPDPKLIIPDPDPANNFGSDRIRINNTGVSTPRCMSTVPSRNTPTPWSRFQICRKQ